MEAISLKIAAIILVSAATAEFSYNPQGALRCGDEICYGSSAYCCDNSDGDIVCCWDTFVYQLWWFWLIWVVVFFLILGCSLACWRRRRAQYRYVVMSNSQYPTYGTVVHSTSSSSQQGGPYFSPATATAPPSYTVQAAKPPPYSG